MYNDLDIAWLAGLFEGEGTFCIGRGFAQGIVIQMTDLDILQRIQDRFGGRVGQSYDRQDKPNWKTCYRWQASVIETDIILPLILPYLGARRCERAQEYMALRQRVLDSKGKQSLKQQNIRAAVASGKTQYEVAEIFGVSQPYINKVMKL